MEVKMIEGINWILWIGFAVTGVAIGIAARKEDLVPFFAILLVGVLGTAIVGISATEETKGLPMENLPQEKLPFYMKSIRAEGNNVYMEIVPYNDINASKQPRYKIPAEKYKDLPNITVGTIIINDGGTIKPFPTSKV